MKKTSAIIVAAGNSSRMGFDKIFAELNGEPVLLYSLRAFQAAKTIDEIIVINENAERIKAFNIPKVVAVTGGGKDRVQSVLNGLNALTHESGYVAIHDGARPLVTPELIDATVQAAFTHKAALPAMLVSETVKQVRDGFVESTPDRSALYSAQTPQVFDLELYRKSDFDFAATDDSTFVERMGVKVKIVNGVRQNIKITTPEDLITARAFLNELT